MQWRQKGFQCYFAPFSHQSLKTYLLGFEYVIYMPLDINFEYGIVEGTEVKQDGVLVM